MPAERPMLLLPNPLDLALVHVIVDSVLSIPHDQAQGNALLRPLLAVGRPLAFRLSGKVDIQAMFRNPMTPLTPHYSRPNQTDECNSGAGQS